jgi:hypothetical protein
MIFVIFAIHEQTAWQVHCFSLLLLLLLPPVSRCLVNSWHQRRDQLSNKRLYVVLRAPGLQPRWPLRHLLRQRQRNALSSGRVYRSRAGVADWFSLRHSCPSISYLKKMLLIPKTTTIITYRNQGSWRTISRKAASKPYERPTRLRSDDAKSTRYAITSQIMRSIE